MLAGITRTKNKIRALLAQQREEVRDKASVLRYIKKNKLQKKSPQLKDFLASFEHSVVKALISNLEKAASEHFPESLILCGGVARNKRLRKQSFHPLSSAQITQRWWQRWHGKSIAVVKKAS